MARWSLVPTLAMSLDGARRRTGMAVPDAGGATHWSLRSMARESGLSHTTIWRIWGAFGLQPHRSETFKLSSDPLFVDKVRAMTSTERRSCRWPRGSALALGLSRAYPVNADTHYM